MVAMIDNVNERRRIQIDTMQLRRRLIGRSDSPVNHLFNRPSSVGMDVALYTVEDNANYRVTDRLTYR